MAKHKSYGKKPYAKFFKNKKKEEDKGKTVGFRIGDEIFLDEEAMQYLNLDVKSANDMSLTFNSCKKLSTSRLIEFIDKMYKK